MFSVKGGIEKVCFIHSITKNGVALHSRQRLESSRVGQEYGLENAVYFYRIYGHIKSTVFLQRSSDILGSERGGHPPGRGVKRGV